MQISVGLSFLQERAQQPFARQHASLRSIERLWHSLADEEEETYPSGHAKQDTSASAHQAHKLSLAPVSCRSNQGGMAAIGFALAHYDHDERASKLAEARSAKAEQKQGLRMIYSPPNGAPESLPAMQVISLRSNVLKIWRIRQYICQAPMIPANPLLAGG